MERAIYCFCAVFISLQFALLAMQAVNISKTAEKFANNFMTTELRKLESQELLVDKIK